MKKAFPQKILVVGAGAVGGYFGALLSRAGLEVTFLVREKTHQHITKDGLRITRTEGDFSIRPPLITALQPEQYFGLIILAVKCPDVEKVLPQLAPLIEQGACLLTLQNGISTEDQILSVYPKASLLAGVAYITARAQAPGHIVQTRRGMIALGERSGEKSARARAVSELFSNAGIPCKLRNNIQRAKWEKLCWNATFNPLTVLLNAPISLILEDDALLEIVRKGMSEVIAVAKSEGIFLDHNIIDQNISASVALKDFYSSMYEDFKNGKPSEIDFLNGAIVKLGLKHGIATPTHQMLWALVKGRETGSKQSCKP